MTPAIVEEKEGRIPVFDLNFKSKKLRLLKSKSLFLNNLSQLKWHHFGLTTTRGHYKFTIETLDDINLDTAKRIKI